MIKRLFQQPWFWPQEVREAPGLINRIGRVFHWTWVAISAPLFVIGAISGAIWIWKDFTNTGALYDEYDDAFVTCLLLSVVTWLIGRGGRYVLSGE